MSSQTSTYKFIFIPRSALVASVILHLCFPVGFLTLKVLEYFNIQVFPPNRKVHEVYQDYVQVDMVALPDIPIKDLDKVDVTAPVEDKVAEAAKAEEDAMLLEAKQKLEQEIKVKEDAKKKALAKLEEEAKREAALKALAQDGKRGRKKLKGNLLSQGAATSGNIGTPKDRYDSLIQAKIKERFIILPNQANRGLVAIVHIEIFPTGRVREKRLEKLSGDNMYDSTVMQAIDEAQPLPVPEDLSLLRGGITITFNADESPRVK
jgi:TonB family protein